MRPSLLVKPFPLVLPIALLHHPDPTDAAFVHERAARTLSPGSYRRCHGEINIPPLLAVVSPSSSDAELAETPRRSRHSRHPLFLNANAVSESMPVPHPESWRKFLPVQHPRVRREPDGNGSAHLNDGSFWNAARNFLAPRRGERRGESASPPANDVHVRFTDPADGARELSERCGAVSPLSQIDESAPSETTAADAETLRHLTNVLSRFQSVAGPPDGLARPECVARVVASVGSAGAKCPRWHADHVPVRLTMGLVGPGCEYVPEIATANGEAEDGPKGFCVDRTALNGLDEEDTARANEAIVPGGDVIAKRAGEGEAVMLVGRGWEDDAGDDDAGRVRAAVHRSPALRPGQERILLTVDLADW